MRRKLDAVTGLYTAETFLQAAEELLFRHPEKEFVFAIFGFDNFRLYKDVFGEDEATTLRKMVGEGCRRMQDKNVLFGIWENDCFVALLEKSAYTDASALDAMDEVQDKNHPEFHLIMRMGICEITDRSLRIQQISRRAVLAMQRIRGNYQKRISHYTEEMLRADLQVQEIVSEMELALQKEQFIVYFQPQYNQIDRSLYGAEALVRWQHPTKGMISPGVFVPIFEKNGFISKLDEYVLEQVCKYQRAWMDQGIEVVPVSVNLSRIDVGIENICDSVFGMLKKYHLSPDKINLEITESAYSEDSEKIIAVAKEFKRIGFKVEMDDFGSGFSSLNALKDIPSDVLKMDMKFLDSSYVNDRGRGILTSVIRMAHGLGMSVIAEGVETEEQLSFLRSVGCFYIQGYYFDRPMPAQEYEKRLRTHKPDLTRDNRLTQRNRISSGFWESSEQISLLLDNAIGAAGIVEYDGGTVRMIRYNDAFYKMLGTTREDYRAYHSQLRERFDAQSWNRYLSAIQTAVETMDYGECEILSAPIGNREKPFWTRTKFKFLSEYDNVYRFLSVVEDIDEEKQAEEQNYELTRRLNSLIDCVPGGIIRMKLYDDYEVIYANEGIATMFGYSFEEFVDILRNDIFQYVHPDDRERLVHATKNAVKKKQSYLEIQYRQRCKDGSYKWIRYSAKIENHRDGNPIANIVLIDLSGFLADQQELLDEGREKQKKKELILDRIGHSISSTTFLEGQVQELTEAMIFMDGFYFKYSPVEDRITYISQGLTELLGYNREEFEKKFHGHFSQIVWKEDLSYVRRCIEGKVKNHSERIYCAFRIETKSGEKKWVKATIVLKKEEDGRQWYLVCIQDRSKKKEQQKQFQKLEQLNEVLDNNFHGGVTRFKVSGKRWTLDHCTRGYMSMLGYTMEQMNRLLKNDVLALIHPEDRERVRKDGLQSARNGTSYETQFRILCSNGKYIWIDGYCMYVGKPDDGYQYMTQTNITNMKEMEKELERDKKQLETIADAIPGGIVMFEILAEGKRIVYASKGVGELSGRSTGDYEKHVMEDANSGTYPPDAKRVDNAFVHAVETGEEVNVNYRIQHTNGQLIWLNMSGRVIGEQNGNPLFLAIFSNLSNQTELFYNIMDETLVSVVISDITTKDVLYANEPAKNMAGILGKASMQDLCEMLIYDRLQDENGEQRLEYRYADAFQDKWLIVRFLKTDWNDISSYVCYIVDATSQKQNEVETAAIAAKKIRLYQGMLNDIEEENEGELLARFFGDLTENVLLDSWQDEDELVYDTGGKAWELFGALKRSGFRKEDREFLQKKLDREKLKKLLQEREYASTVVEFFRASKSGKINWVRMEVKAFVDPGTDHWMVYIFLYNATGEKIPPALVEYMTTRDLEKVSLHVLHNGQVQAYHPDEHKIYLGTEKEYEDGCIRFADDHLPPDKKETFLWAVNINTALMELASSPGAYRCSFITNFNGEKRRKTWMFSYMDEERTLLLVTRMDTTASYIDKSNYANRLNEMSQKLEYMKYDITGVLNKVETIRKIKHKMEGLNKESGETFALLMIDMDDLKRINDYYGHMTGDHAIKAMAEQLGKQFRGTDVIGRVGGDEFMVFLDGIHDTAVIGEKLIELIRSINEIPIGEEKDKYLQCSIGCVIAEYGERSFEKVYELADRALYEAKNQGKNQYCILQ